MGISWKMIDSDICRYRSHRKKPGNTKHVRDGHWFVEIYGKCSKHEVSDGTFPNKRCPPFNIFQGYIILDVDFCEFYRFGLTRARAPQKVFFLISVEWSAEKGIRRSGRQVPVNMFVSLAAFTSLPCMFSLTLHLNFRHFDCLSAEFISPLLLFSEASL